MLALRVNYVGELGWELHAPIECMTATYEALWRAGEEFGIRDFGMYAMDSLRLEKGYRGWKGDLTHEYTPLMASLERFVAFDKGDFVGRAALAERARRGAEGAARFAYARRARRSRPALLLAGLPRRHDLVGLTVSSGYGHAIGKAIALAYVRADLATPGQALQVEILGRPVAAQVRAEPLYDPTNARLRS